jgi:hypothetical protein
MKNIRSFLTVALSVLLLVGSFSASATKVQGAIFDDSDNPSNLSWYLVCQLDKDGKINVLSQMQVELAAPLGNLSDEDLVLATSGPNRYDSPLIARLFDKNGKLVYQKVERITGLIRGEFEGANPGDPIDGHFFEAEEPIFVVRVPVIKDSVLSLKKFNSTIETTIDLEEMQKSIPQINQEKQGKLSSVAVTGNPDNRMDLLIMGDGFIASQEGLFNSFADTISQEFFNISPLAEYKNYFNIQKLFTASAESGADHPPYDPDCSGGDNPACCPEHPDDNPDPLAGTYVDTKFDGRYCAYRIHRLLVVDYHKTVAEAGVHYPDWDTIIMIINDNTYGGSGGGSLSVVSSNVSAVSISQHEFGHSFGRLADEYQDDYPGYGTCSDISGPIPCEANVTDVTDRNQIKWRFWIDPNTPIPTLPNNYGPEFVGLFEGARYRSQGMFRSGEYCLMQYLHSPFCAVPSQALVLRLYDGGWGTPLIGIRQIEPGSAQPDAPAVFLTYPEGQTFSVDVLNPVGGPPASIQWYDGDRPIPGANQPSFTYKSSLFQPGEHRIRVVVRDKTSFVNPNMASETMKSEHQWAVFVEVPAFDIHWIHFPIISR